MEDYEYTDGQRAFSLDVAVPPFSVAMLVSEDDTDDSRLMLLDLEANWHSLWPMMLNFITESLPDLDLELKLEEQEIAASCSRLKSNEYLSDKADTFVSFSFDTGPDWDFFVRGNELVHSQPSF